MRQRHISHEIIALHKKLKSYYCSGHRRTAVARRFGGSRKEPGMNILT
jgi:hypothetical protein